MHVDLQQPLQNPLVQGPSALPLPPCGWSFVWPLQQPPWPLVYLLQVGYLAQLVVLLTPLPDAPLVVVVMGVVAVHVRVLVVVGVRHAKLQVRVCALVSVHHPPLLVVASSLQRCYCCLHYHVHDGHVHDGHAHMQEHNYPE